MFRGPVHFNREREKRVTNADDRATLETLGRVLTVLWEHDADKIPNLLDRRAVTYRDPAGCLAALRSALQVPDAAVLERAAEILDREMECSVAGQVRNLAGSLRQPPVPEPEPDVFERFEVAWNFDEEAGDLASHARDWFGPLVDALEMIAKHGCGTYNKPAGPDDDRHCGECAWCIAKEELAQLRARAKTPAPPNVPEQP